MALSSPGVEVSIIDESQYATTSATSVPLIVVASAESKQSATSTSVASATTKSNANKLYQVTSQRDLLTLYGTPLFYKTTDGTPVHGYELNEYGLQTAYSALGVTNLAYILRADIDLGSLVGTETRPRGMYADGAVWNDPDIMTSRGLYVLSGANTSTKAYTQVSLTYLDYETSYDPIDGRPLWTTTAGKYALNPYQTLLGTTVSSTYWYKTADSWVRLGSREWQTSIPTFTLTLETSESARNFQIQYGTGLQNTTADFVINLTLPADTDASGFSDMINQYGLTNIRATASGSTVYFYLNDERAYPWMIFKYVDEVSNASNTMRRMAPIYQVGGTSGDGLRSIKNTQWANGSMWFDIASNLTTKMQYNLYLMASRKWVKQSVGFYKSDAQANTTLDKSSGGLKITKPSFYLRVASNDFSNQYQPDRIAPAILMKRESVGPTIAIGSDTTPTVTNGSVIKIAASIPLTSTMTPWYSLSIVTTGGVSKGLADAINSHSVLSKYIEATVVSGAIKLIHSTGGTIWLDDTDSVGTSNGVIAAYGLGDVAQATGFGPAITYTYTNKATTTTGAGTGATITVTRLANSYLAQLGTGTSAGYAVDDDVFVAGTLLGGSVSNDLTLKVLAVSESGAITSIAISSGSPVAPVFATEISGWKPVSDLLVNNNTPYIDPDSGTLWNFSDTTSADIMVNVEGVWKGYRNVYFGSDGLPELDETGNNASTPATDPNGPMFAAIAPTTQSDGTDLVYGDLWIDTSDVLNYPAIYRWQQDANSEDYWAKIDTTDQVNPSGILFADMRWAHGSTIDPVGDDISTIARLLTSNYLDIDAPDPELYPSGMIVWNTRRSGNNVKKFVKDYFNETDFPTDTLPLAKNAWVSASGKDFKGVAYVGRKAVRNMVVAALKSAIQTNTTIREEGVQYTLITVPGYPELHADMVSLNNDIGEIAYCIGDTPLRLSDQASDLTAWMTNANSATSSGEDGMVTTDVNLGVSYPSGLASDLTGADIVVPTSHMILRTFLRSDAASYPWYAAAGTRRGTIDNVNNIGYLDAKTGEFIVVKNRVEIRDVLYTNNVNPITFMNGVGLVNYGNKNTKDTQSAWNRTNVSRLINYLRAKVALAARPFLFEPNDELTRSQVREVVNSIMIDLVGKRGITNYVVQCDAANNTADRIDRNELWVDIAIVPQKSVEFINIPIRLVNTGEI